jgi:hypothetical protein
MFGVDHGKVCFVHSFCPQQFILKWFIVYFVAIFVLIVASVLVSPCISVNKRYDICDDLQTDRVPPTKVNFNYYLQILECTNFCVRAVDNRSVKVRTLRMIFSSQQ